MTVENMFSFGYRDRKWRIVKDVCFSLVGLLLIWRGSFLGTIIGAAALAWYGYDCVLQYRALKAERKAAAAQDQPTRNSGPSTAQQDGKITITDLSDAKEVNFEKEQ